MSAETLLILLLRFNLIASAAMLLVLALRPIVLRFLGAKSAYWLWLIVPLAVTGGFLPAREQPYVPQTIQTSIAPPEFLPESTEVPALQRVTELMVTKPLAAGPTLAEVVLGLWLLVAMALLLRSIVSTRRLAGDSALGPALVGVLNPRLVLPPDFETRFDATERELILAHEEVHRVSHHALINALVELLRCANWFNPLVHLGTTYLRTDQELACDATVISTRPASRRAYAEALLKSRISTVYLPLGCTWSSRSGRRLGQRIEMLARPALSLQGAIFSAAVVLLLSLGLGYAAWAQQEPQIARPVPKWTPSADIPEGSQVLSHQLEAQRHDLFIELAQKGNIDVVFFGATDTEMFGWPERGKSVWEKAFANIPAANFGSQGTVPKSLLWRMQNGELDGYEAKLVVFQLWGIGDIGPVQAPDRLDGLAPVLAEIKARQPEAKILLSAPFPRGNTSIEQWRQVARNRAERVAPFVDNETVFYMDIGERFYRADGSFESSYWNQDLDNRGTQKGAFEVWVEELQPWLDRFVR